MLLSFRLNDNAPIAGAAGGSTWWDKVPTKFEGWGDNRFKEAGFRAVPGSVVRRSAYIAPNVVLMPSFVNLGAYVDSGTMVDTWATVGSCAQIGKNCHISGGAGIGGVLEPLQAGPVIIEDNCFIGARAEVAEGVVVREGSVLSMGVYLGASTKIVDRETGEVHAGRGAALFRGRLRHAAGQADAERPAGPEPLLRGHRQARRREDALQDQHQRTVARLSCRDASGASRSSRMTRLSALHRAPIVPANPREDHCSDTGDRAHSCSDTGGSAMNSGSSFSLSAAASTAASIGSRSCIFVHLSAWSSATIAYLRTKRRRSSSSPYHL